MIIREVPYHESLGKIVQQLTKGAFLVAKAKDQINVMTIGWCLAGYMWNRPIFQIVVRTSRLTFSLLEEGHQFTVSLPYDRTMENELLYCGTHSGRTFEKIKGCGLTFLPSQKVDVPVVANCSLYYECKILAKQRLPIESISDEESFEDETDGGYHVMFYGEIVASYEHG